MKTIFFILTLLINVCLAQYVQRPNEFSFSLGAEAGFNTQVASFDATNACKATIDLEYSRMLRKYFGYYIGVSNVASPNTFVGRPYLGYGITTRTNKIQLNLGVMRYAQQPAFSLSKRAFLLQIETKPSKNTILSFNYAVSNTKTLTLGFAYRYTEKKGRAIHVKKIRFYDFNPEYSHVRN